MATSGEDGEISRRAFLIGASGVVVSVAACGDQVGGGKPGPDGGAPDPDGGGPAPDGGAGQDAGPGASPSSGSLPEGHYVAAKMPLHVVYPRPDAETNAWARHRKAYPGLLYAIPIAIQGGAFPHFFEILEGPDGMTIENDPNSPEYAWLKWTPPEAAAAQPVEILVTDQEGATTTVTFQVTATTTGFLFVDPSVELSGDGTIGSPLRFLWESHGDFADSATSFAGGIVYLRAGNHDLTLAQSWYKHFRGDRHPMTWLGYPGDATPVITFDPVVLSFADTVQSRADFFAANLVFRYNSMASENSRFISPGGGGGDRFTMFNIAIRDSHIGVPPVGTADNSRSFQFNARENVYRRYLTFWNVRGENMGQAIFGSYTTQYLLIHGASVSNSLGVTGSSIWFPKSQTDKVTIRMCAFYGAEFPDAMALNNYNAGRSGTEFGTIEVEICYNLFYANADRSLVNPKGQAGTTTAVGSKVWFYRNTVTGHARSGQKGAFDLLYENNVLLTSQDKYAPSGENYPGFPVTVNVVGDVGGTWADRLVWLDSTGKLKDSYRATYLGTHGCEIAGYDNE
jgi:hypothetical protein